MLTDALLLTPFSNSIKLNGFAASFNLSLISFELTNLHLLIVSYVFQVELLLKTTNPLVSKCVGFKMNEIFISLFLDSHFFYFFYFEIKNVVGRLMTIITSLDCPLSVVSILNLIKEVIFIRNPVPVVHFTFFCTI